MPLLIVTSPTISHSQQNSSAMVQLTSPSTSDLLKLTVTVATEKGGFVTGLTKDDFAVWEGKTQHEIKYFSSNDLPASVGVLVDVSGSVKPQTVELAKHAVEQLVQQSRAENEYFITEFGVNARDLVEWTQDAQTITEGLNKLGTGNGAKQKPKPQGQTALYDTCVAALKKVAEGKHSKRVLLIISDGQDNSSRHTLNQLKQLVKESDALIYGINVFERYDMSEAFIIGHSILDELALISGGRAYVSEGRKQVAAVVERISMELRHQYVVGFMPANAAQRGKWNKVKIKVTPPDATLGNLSVRSREGYFSPMSAP
jgi:Ca-activated chloride channel family protein